MLEKYTKDSSGFSFMELMVVIAMIGILSAVALPGLLRALPEQRLKNAARNLYADMQRARLLAVKENRKVHVRFDTTGNFYYFDDDEISGYTAGQFRRNLSEDGDVTFGKGKAEKNWNGDDITIIQRDIVFNPTGTAGPQGPTYLQNKNENICYVVSVYDYGAVKIRRFNGTKWDD
jgi:type IV fimbrial biogenesis protein FimT